MRLQAITGVVAAVAAVAGAALGYAYSRLQSAPITLSKSSKKSLIDLEQDLLERGTARGESSLAQRAAAKVVTEGARVLDRVQMQAAELLPVFVLQGRIRGSLTYSDWYSLEGHAAGSPRPWHTLRKS